MGTLAFPYLYLDLGQGASQGQLPAANTCDAYHGGRRGHAYTHFSGGTERAVRNCRSYFDKVILGEDCARPKPHPDPYQAGLDFMSLKPDECICVRGLACWCDFILA